MESVSQFLDSALLPFSGKNCWIAGKCTGLFDWLGYNRILLLLDLDDLPDPDFFYVHIHMQIFDLDCEWVKR